jgi:myo-inositol-1(or 4)-monophosphatase
MTDLEFVRDLSERAGTLALAALRTLRREYKPDDSLVTNVDRAVESYLRRELATRFPGDAFYGEEAGGDPLSAERVWIVDPVDGTTNMAAGLPIWGVSVGLVVGGVPELGAFHLPRLGETFWFHQGEGSYLNGERLQVTERGPLHQEDPVAVGSEAIFVLDLDRFVCRQRNLGSLAAHYCYAAAGSLRASVSVRDRLHDLGAAYGVATEAGCAIEYLDDGPVSLATFLRAPVNLRPLLVGSPGTLTQLRQVLRERPSGIDTLE